MFYLDMVDSIGSPETTGTPIPQAILKARAVAAYIAGNSWPTYGPYSHARPDLVAAGRLVSITLTAGARARCLDIESGGATAGQAPGWFRNRADSRRGKPILYTFASNTHTVIDTMASAGIPRDAYYIWSAHFRSRFGKHMCGPGTCGYPQADITQWTDQVPENCDGSICESYVFAPVAPPPPPPPPPPPKEAQVVAPYLTADHRVGFVAERPSGEVLHIEQQNPSGESGGNADFWRGTDGKPNWLSLGIPS